MDEIFNRGTCRYFKELTPVPDEELLTLVKAGMHAGRSGKSHFSQQHHRRPGAQGVCCDRHRRQEGWHQLPGRMELRLCGGCAEHTDRSRAPWSFHPVDAGVSVSGQKDPSVPYLRHLDG